MEKKPIQEVEKDLKELFDKLEFLGKQTFIKLKEKDYLSVAYALAKLEDGIFELKDYMCVGKKEEENYNGDVVCFNDKVYKITEAGFREYIKDDFKIKNKSEDLAEGCICEVEPKVNLSTIEKDPNIYYVDDILEEEDLNEPA